METSDRARTAAQYMRRGSIILLVGLWVAGSGCSDDTDPTLKCGEGTIEYDGQCVVECPDGEVPSNGQCVEANGGGDVGSATDAGSETDAGSDAGGEGEFELGPVSASPQTVEAGEAVEIVWTSTGADFCEPAGELVDWSLLDPTSIGTEGPATFEVPEDTEPGIYDVGISCTSNGSSLEQMTNVEVVSTDPCDSPDRQMPSTWTRLTTGELSCSYTQGGSQITSADCTSYEGIWGGSFMDVTGISLRLGLRELQWYDYMAIELTTEGLSSTATGTLALNTTPSLQNSRKLVSISQCPGDFDKEAIEAETGCYRAANTQNVNWGGVDTDRLCILEADKTYFLNIVYTESDLGTPSAELEPSPTCINPDLNPCGNLLTNFQ